MAQTNYERVGKVLDKLRELLKPYVLGELKAAFPGEWKQRAAEYYSGGGQTDTITADPDRWDIAAVLNIMIRGWNEVFKKVLGQSERTLVFELRDARNHWAHQQQFSTDDTYRVYDNAERLLSAIAAPEAEEIRTQKEEILRQRYEKRARKVVVKVKNEPTQGLKGWRDVIDPHPDVASGKFSQAEFAADLWEVYKGKGAPEYLDPREFFHRTYITEGMASLLQAGIDRLSGEGGDPVIELQTNFGGGKTHSMLALYHLFGDVPATELSGADALNSGNIDSIPRSVSKAVIVGNKLQPARPRTMEDGTVLNTLWGELAYQIGGADGYAMVADADRSGTNAGDALTELFNRFAPCLVLIDEWVAYARELYTKGDLPAGTFDSQFTFAQTLSESAKNADRTFLVVSVPASDNEIGGEGGRAALDRLKNAIGRVQSPWQPASKEEAFEIVRRRLFQEIRDYKAKDAVVKAFGDLYDKQRQDVPREVIEAEYQRRLSRAYPIHPELFDQLYETWSTIDRFQRTRGVLRLMAAVINSLWERGDSGPLIMPASVPLDDPAVRTELTKFLPSNWVPIIERDVDGQDSLPRAIEKEVMKLDRISAVRKVARTIFMATAPITQGAHQGVDQRKVTLGTLQPGEQAADYSDALRRLAGRATYLYSDSGVYWYGDQPTVRRLADDRAAQFRDKPDLIHDEIVTRLREEVRKDKADFARVHVAPSSSADVLDEPDAALVIIDPSRPHLAKTEDSDALEFAQQLLHNRANSPRVNQNALVFLAADKSRLSELEAAVSQYLAWKSIVRDADAGGLNLQPSQQRQAQDQQNSASTTVDTRIPETFQWLMHPVQKDPRGQVELSVQRLTSGEGLADRVYRKLKGDGAILSVIGGARLRYEIDRIPLWREGGHVSIGQLMEDFARFPYLPRLTRVPALLSAVQEGVSLMTWEREGFAYAERYDEEEKRYVGLLAQQTLFTTPEPSGLVVKPEVANRQLQEELQPPPGDEPDEPKPDTPPEPPLPPVADRVVRRFHGVVDLPPAKPGSTAGKVAEEVVQHLLVLDGAQVSVKLEIAAEVPDGIPEEKRRVIEENCRTLKFEEWGLEEQ